jgi:eukaryotic-like serine/threonine-protein kinase
MQDPIFYKQETIQEFAPQPQPPEVMPKQIGPYPIDSLLHQGKISLLYLGVHPETKHPLAIKVLAQRSLAHPELIDNFLKEARIIAMADHPNIIKLYGEGEWDKGLYIAMEFIQGVSLRQFIVQRSLSFKRSLEIILQAAFAVLHLHTHGVIHRDIKPENILIQEDGQVKVIDFGVAQLLEETRDTARGLGRLIGTPSYMSPEQKENPANVCFASDIYALGIISYELIAGKLSYGIIDLASIPKSLRPIIEKSLAPQLKDRYQDIVDFIHDISNYLKSGEWEKDRPGRDQLKELMSETVSAQQMLLPQETPEWPQLDLSLAKHPGTSARGLYCDFFKLPNNTFVFFLAHSNTNGITSLAQIAILRGMLRALIRKQEISLQKPLDIIALVTVLNHLFLEEKTKESCSLQILLLDPLMEQLRYLSCGESTLLHIPSETHEPRYLHAENPLLGVEERVDYMETVDNWAAGDILLLHSLDPFASLHAPEEEKQLFLDLIKAHLSLAMARQAEAILKKTVSDFSLDRQKNPYILLELQRLL